MIHAHNTCDRPSKPWLRPALAFALLIAAANAIGFSGCARRESSTTALALEPAPIVDDAAMAAARAFYVARCAECHGPQGQGNGPRAATLRPRPQHLGDRIWQSNVSNARLQRALLHGGLAVGKSEVMPGFRELQAQPQTLLGLVALLRSFADP